MYRPLCFVLMPFGTKPDLSGSWIDFDAVYQDLIVPAITHSGFDALRADEEMTGGIIHKSMFERLILCEYAVADLTTANANVFYELGVRHAVRPWSTVLIFAEGGGRLPFDLAPLRAIPYRLSAEGKPTDFGQTRLAIAKRLLEAKGTSTDSPVFQLVEGFPAIDHTKTDIFRDQVSYSEEMKGRLATARQLGLETLHDLEKEIGDIASTDSAVVIDLFLSYRAVKGWPEMINVAKKMSRPLSGTALVQEQLALALNRNGKGKQAEAVLLQLIEKRGPHPETYGILGRVYKDWYEAANQKGDTYLAKGCLEKAIDAYLRGFEADWRDAYPGINAVTLMEVKEPPDPRREQLIPIVAYAVERRIASGKPDYWDHATRLELAVLAKDDQKATAALCNALAAVREQWEPETTARNLHLIDEARGKRNEFLPWARGIEERLRQVVANWNKEPTKNNNSMTPP